MGYTPYKMKGHTLPGIKQRGVPFTGGVGSNEMESGVGDKFEGMPYSENASPAKGLFGAIGNIFKKGAKKVGGALGGAFGGALGLAKKGEGGGPGGKIKAMDDRISALEEGMSSGSESKVSTTDPITGRAMGGVGDPILDKMMAGGAAADPSTLLTKEEMKKKMGEGWGGVGEAQAV